MHTVGVVRDKDGLVRVDINYILAHPNLYVYETTYDCNGYRYLQYRFVPDISRGDIKQGFWHNLFHSLLEPTSPDISHLR